MKNRLTAHQLQKVSDLVLLNPVNNGISHWRKKSFTLIELLIVIAIIAILAGMLLPVLNKARATAWQTNCQSNMKSIITTALYYSSDYSDWILPADFGYASQRGTWWALLLVNYKLPGKLFGCSANKINLTANDGNTAFSRPAWINTEHFYLPVRNSLWNMRIGHYNYAHYMKLGHMKKTSTNIIGLCGAWRDGSNPQSGCSHPKAMQISYTEKDKLTSVHPGGFPISFADGHIGIIKSHHYRGVYGNTGDTNRKIDGNAVIWINDL